MFDWCVGTCDSDSYRDVEGGEEPQEDDGEESADGEEDEDASAVHDGPDEEEQAEHWAHTQQRHRGRPTHSLDLLNTAICQYRIQEY